MSLVKNYTALRIEEREFETGDPNYYRPAAPGPSD
jgi:hypothetical protein